VAASSPFSLLELPPPNRPFLSANLNGIPRASYSAEMSSNVFPSAAAAFRIFRVRASHIRWEEKIPIQGMRLGLTCESCSIGCGYWWLTCDIENTAEDVERVLGNCTMSVNQLLENWKAQIAYLAP
jgi:hypothetical protein